MNFFKSLFSRTPPKGDGALDETSTSIPNALRSDGAGQEYVPPDSVNDKLTNLVYQDHSGGKGGSNSSTKLAAIQLPEMHGKRFLDLGCNAGFFCAYAAENGASYTLGVDSSDKVISIAKERHPSLEFRSGGWDEFPDGEFDVVICLSAIHYARDAALLADNIRNCLSAKGVFILEGGLIGAADYLWTDTLIPAWRAVGDKCRHLSRGFVERHLLTDFDWEVVGESVDQGGDPIKRFVIHARPSEGATENDRPAHRLCPVEYASAVALSAPTIHDNQPSSRYVRALGAGKMDGHKLESALNNDENFENFSGDILYALNNHKARLELKASMGEVLTTKLASSLEAKGVNVTLLQ